MCIILVTKKASMIGIGYRFSTFVLTLTQIKAFIMLVSCIYFDIWIGSFNKCNKVKHFSFSSWFTVIAISPIINAWPYYCWIAYSITGMWCDWCFKYHRPFIKYWTPQWLVTCLGSHRIKTGIQLNYAVNSINLYLWPPSLFGVLKT